MGVDWVTSPLMICYETPLFPIYCIFSEHLQVFCLLSAMMPHSSPLSNIRFSECWVDPGLFAGWGGWSWWHPACCAACSFCLPCFSCCHLRRGATQSPPLPTVPSNPESGWSPLLLVWWYGHPTTHLLVPMPWSRSPGTPTKWPAQLSHSCVMILMM